METVNEGDDLELLKYGAEEEACAVEQKVPRAKNSKAEFFVADPSGTSLGRLLSLREAQPVAGDQQG